MSTDLSTLGIAIDSSEVVQGATDLDKLTAAGARAEASANKTGGAWAKAAGAIVSNTDEIVKQLQQLNSRQQAVEKNWEALAAATNKSTKATDDSARSVANETKQLDSLLGKIDPLTKKLNDLAAQETALIKARDSGQINLTAYDSYSKKLQENLASLTGVATAQKEVTSAADASKARILELAQATVAAKQAQLDASNAALENAGAVKQSSTSYASGARSTLEFNTAQDKVTSASKEATSATKAQRDEINKLLGDINPLAKKLNDLNQQEKDLKGALQSGRISPGVWADYQAKIDDTRAALSRLNTMSEKTGISAKQTAAALRGVPAQFTDIVVSLQGGQAPLTVLLQQGGQLKDMFGGVGNALKALGGYVMGLISPLTVMLAAFAAVGVAYYQGSKEQTAYNNALITTGNYAGTSSGALGNMAKTISSTIGTTGAAAEVLAQLADTGKLTSASFEQIAKSALLFQSATGKAASETIAEFVKIADDPVKAIGDLDDKYHFLTASIYQQIVALKEQGDKQGAAMLAENVYAQALEERAQTIRNNLGLVEKAWEGIKNIAKNAWDAMLNVGREDTLETTLVKLKARLQEIKNLSVNPLGASDNPDMIELGAGEAGVQAKVNYTELQIEANKYKDTYIGNQKQMATVARQDFDELKKQILDTASNEDKRGKALIDMERRIAGVRAEGYKVSATEEARLKKNIEDKFKDPKEAKVATPVDYTVFNDAENKLKLLTSTFDNAMRELDALQKGGLISAEEYTLKKTALVTQEKDSVQSAYAAEISALEEIKLRSTTNGNERVQIDQKIADARANMVKATEAADSKLKVIATEEQGRLNKQTEAVKAYSDALNEQVKALQLQGARNAAAVGMGASQKAIFDQLNSLTDKINTQRLNLASQYGDGSKGMSLEEYTEKLKALETAHTDMSDTIVKNSAELKKAQSDWTNGAKSAFQDYIDSANDIAGQTKSAFTNAFNGLEDVFTKFITTGKLSFKDFADSVIADLARIVAKQLIIAPLVSAIFGSSAGGSGSGASSLLSIFGSSGDSSGGSSGGLSLGSLANAASTAYSVITGVGPAAAAGWASGGVGGAASGIASYYTGLATNAVSSITGWFGSSAGTAAATAVGQTAAEAAVSAAAGQGAASTGFGYGGSLVAGEVGTATYAAPAATGSMAYVWPLAILMGMYQSGKLYDQGVRYDKDAIEGSKLSKVGDSLGTAGLDRKIAFESIGIADKALSGLFGGKTGAILSGSTFAMAIEGYLSSKLFGTGYQTKDSGLSLAVNNGDLDANQFVDQKKKKGLFGGSNKSRTLYSDLGDEQETQLQALYGATQLGVIDLVKQIGVTVSDGAFDAFKVAELKISTQGKTDEEIQTAVSAWFSNVSDLMIQELDKGVGGFGYSFTELARRVNVFTSFNASLELIDKQMLTLSAHSMELANALVDADGGIDKFNTDVGTYYTNFFSDSEKTADTLAAIQKQFKAINVTLPDSREGYRAMVEGIDLTTESGQKLFQTLISMSGNAAQLYTILENSSATAAAKIAQDAADMQARVTNNVNLAFAKVQRSVKAAQDELTKQYNETAAALTSASDAAKTSVNDLKTMGNALSAALKSIVETSVENVSVLREQAKSILDSALSTAKTGGSVANFPGLEDALTTLSSNDTSNYASLEDYMRDQGQTANKIDELNKITGKQLTEAQQTVDLLDAQLIQLQKEYDAQMANYETQLAYAQAQLDAINGVDTSVESVALAMGKLAAAISVMMASGGGGSSQANTPQNNSTLLNSVYNTILGRDADPAGQAYWTGLLNSGAVQYSDLAGAIAKDAHSNGEGTLAGFATGGNFGGGWMMVGERGPEAIQTGPATIMNHMESRRMIKNGDNSELVAQVQQLVQITIDQYDAIYATARNTAITANKTTDIEERQQRLEA